MRQRLTLLLVLLGLFSCSPKGTDKQEVNLDNLNFVDKDVSSFELFSEDSIYGNKYKMREINYSIVDIDLYNTPESERFIAKKITTSEAYTLMEGQDRIVQIDLFSVNNPTKLASKIKHDCDDIILNYRNYKTVKYGCCGEADQYKLYDYNNKLIIESNNQIVLARIPNLSTDFYVSFKPENSDTTILGRLNFSYNSFDKYEIVIKSAPILTEECIPLLASIFVKSSDKRNRYIPSENEYEIWSVNNSKAKDEINGVTIQVLFECTPEIKFDTISIPIINGRPFGNVDKMQEVLYKH